jgi:hypothetical protein
VIGCARTIFDLGVDVSAAIPQDFDAATLRRLVKCANQARRLLAEAAIYDGKGGEEAARLGGMDRQTLRDWVHRFYKCGPDGLINAKSPGRRDEFALPPATEPSEHQPLVKTR